MGGGLPLIVKSEDDMMWMCGTKLWCPLFVVLWQARGKTIRETMRGGSELRDVHRRGGGYQPLVREVCSSSSMEDPFRDWGGEDDGTTGFGDTYVS